MKIYQVSVLVTLFSLLHILVMVTERKSYFSQISYWNDRKNKFIQLFIHKFFNAIESRRMHPPNKPHPHEGFSHLESNFFPKTVFKIFKTP